MAQHNRPFHDANNGRRALLTASTHRSQKQRNRQRKAQARGPRVAALESASETSLRGRRVHALPVYNRLLSLHRPGEHGHAHGRLMLRVHATVCRINCTADAAAHRDIGDGILLLVGVAGAHRLQRQLERLCCLRAQSLHDGWRHLREHRENAVLLALHLRHSRWQHSSRASRVSCRRHASHPQRHWCHGSNHLREQDRHSDDAHLTVAAYAVNMRAAKLHLQLACVPQSHSAVTTWAHQRHVRHRSTHQGTGPTIGIHLRMAFLLSQHQASYHAVPQRVGVCREKVNKWSRDGYTGLGLRQQ